MGKKILIIDDEPDILEFVNMRLSSSGFEVITAQNGQEGLDKVKNEKPDLVILDIMMPVMDGFEFFKIVKNDPSMWNIPIVILSARGAMKDTFIAMGVDDFIPKPIPVESLVPKINYLLKDKTIVLSEDPYVIEKINKAFSKHDYEIEVVTDKNEFIHKAKQVKYKVMIVHLAILDTPPSDFKPALDTVNYKDPTIVLYCDTTVKGAESDYAVAIDEIRNNWKRVGVGAFYDARITGKSFSSMIDMWLS